MGIMNLNKVLVSDKIASDCLQVFEGTGIELTYRPGLSKKELLEIIPDYNGLIVRSATKVTKEVIEAAINLEIIGRAGTGTDNIDQDAASAAGVVVMNTPGGNTNSAAEHTCALLLATCRNLANRHSELMNGEWNRINGIELDGKTIGIIGLGRIGMIVAHRMQAFGMKTVGYDPIVPAHVAADKGVELMDLEDMWPVCDFITIHVPLLPSTKHLMNKEVLSKCKKGVRIVNCARGGIIDEDALLDSLNSGKVACAALDVFEKEPPLTDSPLLQHSNLIATPHLGASTAEAQTRVAREIAEQFLAMRDGKSTFGCLNAPLLRDALSKPTEAQLATCLGNLLYHLNPKATVLDVNGYSGSSIPYSVMSGYLSCKGETAANLINIKKIADSNNLSFNFTEAGGSLTVSAGDVSVKGLVDGSSCFITAVNNSQTMIPMKGSLTLVQNSSAFYEKLPTISKSVTGVHFAGDFILISHPETVTDWTKFDALATLKF